MFFQSGSSSYTDLISTTILAHQPSPSPPLHHCPLGFHKQAASPIGFPCQTAPLRFPRPGLLKFESRKEIKFLWFDDIFFLVEMKKFGRKREGDFNRSNHFEAKSSSSSSSSLRFLEVCRFTFSGKKDQAIPLSGFDPWTLSSLLNFPGKVSPLFLVFFLKKQSGVSRFKTHLSYPSSLIPLSLLILLYPFLILYPFHSWFF